ncbi:MAG: biotin/lipoyl-binding protein, partial [Candidatus Eisenbacteria bacterium]
MSALSPELNDSTDLSALRIDRSAPPPRPGSRGRVQLVIGVIAVVALAGFAWARFLPRTIEVRIGLAEATGGGMASRAGISANGYVVARTKASVSSKILGRLAWIGITEGSRVKSGETIARLESADYQAA